MLRKAWKEQPNFNLGKLATRPHLEDQNSWKSPLAEPSFGSSVFNRKKFLFGFMSLINFDTFFYTYEKVEENSAEVFESLVLTVH